MYCSHCGYKLGDDVKFCPQCGMPVSGRDAAAPAYEAPTTYEPPVAQDARTTYEVPTTFELRVAEPTPTRPEPQPTVYEAPAVGAVAPSTLAGDDRIPAPLNLVAAGLAGAAALAMLVSCVISQSFSLLAIVELVECTAIAVLCLLQPKGMRFVIPALAILSFVLSLASSLYFTIHYSFAMLNLASILSTYGPQLLRLAFVVLLTLAFLDRIAQRKTAAFALVAIAAVIALLSLLTLVLQLRNGFPAMYALTQGVQSLCILAARTVAGYGIELGREPGKTWAAAPMHVGTVPQSAAGQQGDEYQHYPHPYHQLGGFLKLIVVMGYVGIGLMTLGGLAVVGSLMFLTNSYAGLGGGLMGTAVAGSALILVAVGVLDAFLWVFLGKIRRKDPTFLRDYHYMMIVGVALGVLSMILGNGAQALGQVLGLLIIAGLYTLYFVRSVRVRTYMGSDAYIRLSPLVSGLPSPVPADTVPYQGQ